MTRRELLGVLGFGAGAAVVVSGCVVPTPAWSPPKPPPGQSDPLPFADGVMAGDPAPNGATIWTRVEPPASGSTVGVVWMVSTDPTFATVEAGGLVTADADTGHTVTVEVDGLDPDRWYHYRFEAADPSGRQVPSRTGRLRTAPRPGDSPDRLRFAFASCQQINDSWFVAHRAAASEPDLDFFMHLGDYVYVSDTGTITLEDYRSAYRRWRAQPMLRDLHAKVPLVAMWDDGEFFNGVDASGDPARLEAAKRAWFDSFPLSDPGGRRAYRRFPWGDLADVSMIDVRAHRDAPVESIDYTQPGGAYEPGRTTLGAEQYSWLTEGLAASSAAWRIIGNPYNIGPWRLLNLEFLRPFRPEMPPNAGLYAPNEAWDDYMAERTELLEFLVEHEVTDTVFASGHTHVWLTSELRVDPDDPGSPVAAHDFCAGSMTADPDPRSAFLGDLPRDLAEGVLRAAEGWVLGQNSPSMRHMNLVDQGYTLVEVTPEEMVVTQRLVNTFDPDAEATDGARFRVRKGAQRMEILPASGASGSFA